MKLSAIAAMFVPDTIWEVDYQSSGQSSDAFQKHRARRVSILRRKEIVWDTGNVGYFYTPLPKASEVIEASDGRLVMRYTHHQQDFTFRRVDDPERAAEIRQHLASQRQSALAEKQADKEAKAKQAADEEAARLAGLGRDCLEGKALPPRDLIDLCESLGIAIPIQTKGAMLRKTTEISSISFTYYKGRLPRFRRPYPMSYYCRAQDILQSQIEEPAAEEPSDPAIDALFTPACHAPTGKDEPVTPPPPAPLIITGRDFLFPKVPASTTDTSPGTCHGIAAGDDGPTNITPMPRLPFGPRRPLKQPVKPLDAILGTPRPAKPTARPTSKDGLAALLRLYGFLGGSQLRIVRDFIRSSEEKDFYIAKAIELEKQIAAMPATYDGRSAEDPICHLHYFTGGCDWWIIEKDTGAPDDEPDAFQSQAYGYACLGNPDSAESGYISLPEILKAGAELDFYFHPTPLSKIRAKLQAA